MSLTKRELVNEVASKLGLTQNEVSGVVQELLDAITLSLEFLTIRSILAQRSEQKG